jgi:predicted nucleic acid-binding protein
MIFADLHKGDWLFLDANILVYHFEPHPTFGAVCSQLLIRIENQELVGFTSTHVLTEVAHRLMMIEASRLPGWASTKVKQRLQRQPAMIQQLTLFRTALEEVLQGHLQILTISAPLIVAAAIVSQQSGLLSNDAMIVAVMQANGLTRLASEDADFDRVPGLTRYAPA